MNPLVAQPRGQNRVSLEGSDRYGGDNRAVRMKVRSIMHDVALDAIGVTPVYSTVILIPHMYVWKLRSGPKRVVNIIAVGVAT